MFELDKFLDTYKKIKNYQNKKKVIESLLFDMDILENKICNECGHNLLLIYNENILSGYNELSASCLACKTVITLKYDKENDEYKEFFKEDIINKDYIIDATKFISSKYCTLEYCDEFNVVVEASKILDRILKTENNLTISNIKNKLIEELNNFYKEPNKKLQKGYKGND